VRYLLWFIVLFGAAIAYLGFRQMRYGRTPPDAYVGLIKIALGIVIVLLLGAVIAFAADYPPVSVLQDELHAHPGDTIAREIPYRGRKFVPRYLGAIALGNGVYSVKLKLDER
jgi:hypothetical protein